jgi:chaperone required for assembly of F1-ATPase
VSEEAPAAKARAKTSALKRRFYKVVDVNESDGGFQIALDGRPVKTPGRATVVVVSHALADAIAAEWDAQSEHINPHVMPLTQIACTAIDKVASNRAEICEQVARFANADLLCYRAESPTDLVARQEQIWQPVLDWLADERGIKLTSTTALIIEDQDPVALKKAHAAFDALDDNELAAAGVLVPALGSCALALAVIDGHLAWEQAATASQLDETFQSELWGMDYEAEQRLRGLRDDIEAAARYLTLHRTKN